MRYLFFFIGVLTCLQSFSQVPFEGIMKWTVAIDNTDNKQKAAYQQEITKEDLSEQNEAIIELEQQLNDPEMQEILIAHPPIKGNMEKRLQELKAAQGDPASIDYSQTANIFLSTIFIKLKNGNSLTEMAGGNMSQMIGDILYVKNQNTTYYIKDATETYTIKPANKTDTTGQVHIGMAKTKDTASIVGYSCTKYIITCTENTDTKISYVWLTQNLQSMNAYSFESLGSSAGSLHNDAFNNLPGVPLRIESYEKGFKMTMEVTEITKQVLQDSNFTIPITYKEATFGY